MNLYLIVSIITVVILVISIATVLIKERNDWEYSDDILVYVFQQIWDMDKALAVCSFLIAIIGIGAVWPLFIAVTVYLCLKYKDDDESEEESE